jgi:hypothetical protein
MRRDKGIVQFPFKSTTKIKHSHSKQVSDIYVSSIDNEMTCISIFAFYVHYFSLFNSAPAQKKINSQITSHFANNQPHPFQHSSRANRDQSSLSRMAMNVPHRQMRNFSNSSSLSRHHSLSFVSVIDVNIADGNSFSSYGHECLSRLALLALALLSNPNNHNREIILPENGLI